MTLPGLARRSDKPSAARPWKFMAQPDFARETESGPKSLTTGVDRSRVHRHPPRRERAGNILPDLNSCSRLHVSSTNILVQHREACGLHSPRTVQNNGHTPKVSYTASGKHVVFYLPNHLTQKVFWMSLDSMLGRDREIASMSM